MQERLSKLPSRCTVLIVDDEPVIVELLEKALKPRYTVYSSGTLKEALDQIERQDFDIVVADLKLPDGSGLDVLTAAKSRDEFTEVIVITGYATLDLATTAINMGVTSFLTKPLLITDFQVQVEKAAAARLFHLKSISLMRHGDHMEPDAKDHLYDLTSLYYFTRKLMLSLEVNEIARITLEEVNQRMNATLSVIGIDLPGYTELYAMPSTGEAEVDRVKAVLSPHLESAFSFVDKKKFGQGEVPVYLYKGKQGEAPSLEKLRIISLPMMVTGKTIGSLAVFHTGESSGLDQYLYIFTSLVASILEHGYADLQAQVQAKTDSLTGIANHRQFHETLEREIARANRRKGIFSLVLIDIDDFKKINDTYGHQIGDAVIIDLTRRVNRMIRAGDVLARYGGEEFGLILPDTDGYGAEILAGRICREFSSKPFHISQLDLNYTSSIGIALYSGDHQSTKDELIARADKALYSSKRNGKNRVTLSV